MNRRQFLLTAGSAVAGLAAADAFTSGQAAAEQPAYAIRSISRLFVSEVEDKPWYYDRAFWERYLSMLAEYRFNRFQLAFGLGYDFLSEVTDAYFHFAYPFLLAVPGYDVRVAGLPDEERDRNLETLRFISDAAEARGLHFQLGLWTHGYDWSRNRGVNYTIQGLSPANHAAYCRDALRALLLACPAVRGVTLRTHGESGIPEATYSFWQTVLDGIRGAGRQIEIDLHAKGLDQRLIDLALDTGMPVTVAPKFWAEHMGLPYHQAAIRALEMPPQGRADRGFFALSNGSRRFLRYGYGDLMSEGRRYRVLFRMWPGTQRLLLWGDPAMAAAYSRAASFCGAAGLDLFEPLSFKGRKGSGLPGGRDGYADPDLKPTDGDWEKYRYGYCLWGRMLLDPDADPATWRDLLRRELGSAAPAAERALAHASRILPLVTTAHDPSAANNNYWPEMYTNMPIVDAGRPHPYGDTPSPKRFGTVSPLDPELFSSIEEFVASNLAHEPDHRYSPAEVAQWLDRLAAETDRALADMVRAVGERRSAAARRLEVDARIQSALGRFFAAKLRAGALYTLHERSGSHRALMEALKQYRAARSAWSRAASVASGVYRPDITFGKAAHLRGHWSDRLAAIDADIADMEKRAAGAAPGGVDADALVRAVLAPAPPPQVNIIHEPPDGFRRGAPVPLEVRVERPESLQSVALRYRRVNQAERYQEEEMRRESGVCRATVPAAYTDSPFPLLYYFIVRTREGVTRFPDFGPDLCGQPYYVLRQR